MNNAKKLLMIAMLPLGILSSTAFATGRSPALRYRMKKGSTSIQAVTTQRNASRTQGYATSANLDGSVTISKVQMFRGGGEKIKSTRNLGKAAVKAAKRDGFTNVALLTGRDVRGSVHGTTIFGSGSAGLSERGNVRMKSDQGVLIGVQDGRGNITRTMRASQ